jgi:hypothetical protein
VIWEPFLMALILGLLMSAGLYFAYLWPSVEPDDESTTEGTDEESPKAKPAEAPPPPADSKTDGEATADDQP